MARVLVVCPSFSFSKRRHRILRLLQNIQESQHKIRLVTTYRPDGYPEDLPNNVEYLQPFKKWGYLEVPQLIRCLHGFSVEVVHFILEPELISYRLLPLIPAFLETRQKAFCVTQFVGPITKLSSFSQKWIFQMSDAVITDSRWSKLQLSSEEGLFKSPAFFQMGLQNVKRESVLEDHWISQQFSKFIYSPAPISQTMNLQSLVSPHSQFLKTSRKNALVFTSKSEKFFNRFQNQIAMKKLGLQDQVIVLPQLTEDEHGQLMKDCFISSSVHLQPLDHRLTDLSHQAAEFQKYHLVPELFLETERPLQNCWSVKYFLNSSSEDLENIDWSPDANFSQENQISRIYSELLNRY